ncbi:DUF559 domain-containing protein [Ilumatobacter fluminis]|uniref:DUF559 domain-containing protein n=1 Tax=Ilumatobacter fluminis TaxID=467091 RepID=UPI0032F05B6B
MQIERFDDFAAHHHGLITRSEAERLGTSRDAWHRALRSGKLVRIHPGVARLPGAPTTREQAILAAVLALRQGASASSVVMASHRSAAALLGLRRPFDDPVDVIADRGCQRRLEGVVVHRPVDRLDLVPTHRQRIPTTNELRTLVDLGAVDAGAVAAALDHFTVERRIGLDTLSALLARHSRQGRSGVVALRTAIGAWPVADDIPDSVLEVAMGRLIRDHRLPPARFHAHLAGFEVDFHFVGTPVVVECDGWQYHVADRDAWERDHDRDAQLHAEGFVVVRLPRRRILFEPDVTAATLHAVLERWRVPPAA